MPLVLLLLACLSTAPSPAQVAADVGPPGSAPAPEAAPDTAGGAAEPEPGAPAPLVYLVLVRSWLDSDADGHGDLRGLAAHLDRVAALGATTLWLAPLTPADDGWGEGPTRPDRLDPRYGDDDAWRSLDRAADEAGLGLAADLPVNAVGAAHPAFPAACAGDEAAAAAFRWLPPDAELAAPFAADPGCGRGPWLARAGAALPDRAADGAAALAERRAALGFHLGLGLEALRLADVDGWADGPRGELDREGSLALAAGLAVELGELAGAGQGGGPGAAGAAGGARPPGPGLVVATDDDVVAASDWAVALGPQAAGLATGGRRAALLAALDTHDGTVLIGTLAEEAERGTLATGWTWLEGPRTPRLPTTLPDPGARRVARVLQYTLPGVPALLYGAELDLPDALDGPGAPALAPMPWEALPGGGFSAGHPWTALAEDPPPRSLREVMADPGSTWSLLHSLGRLRAALPVFTDPAWRPLPTGSPAAFAFVREAGGQRLVVLLNLGPEALEPGPLPIEGAWTELGSGSATEGAPDAGTLPGWTWRLWVDGPDPGRRVPGA